MIQFNQVQFSYKNSSIFNITNLDLTINQGEFILLTGKSGEGKTTMTRLLNGLIPHFFQGNLKGEIKLWGHNYLEKSMDYISQYTGSVFQDPRSQFFCLDVISELAFTCENFGISPKEIKKRIDDAVSTIEIEELLEKKVFALSSGERQKVAIASILTQKPKILLFDEPSSNLDYNSVNKLKKLMEKLKSQGYTIIISEHKLYYLRELFDKLCYIESGEIKELYCQKSIKTLKPHNFEAKGLRTFDICNLKPKKTQHKHKELVVNIENLSFGFKRNKKIIDNLSLKLYKGESTVILGKNGAGKTTLAKLIVGLYKEKEGTFSFYEKKLKAKERLKNVSLVLQDADYQLFSESVWSEFLLGYKRKNLSEEEIQSLLEKFNLTSLKERHPSTLSGGQKQRLTIALTYLKDTPLVIMDEPTSGLDYINMLKVTDLIDSLKKQGKSVLIITHDYEFMMKSCDRVINLKEGKVEDDFYLTEKNMNKIKYIHEEE